MRRVVITSQETSCIGALRATETADSVWNALPIEGQICRWGDEIYFETGICARTEPDAAVVVPPGTLCLWCEGQIIAMPYGPTPIALKSECRLIAPVNIWGDIEGELRVLDTFEEGSFIRITALDATTVEE